MLGKIISFSIKNKLVIGVMTLALIVWGVWSTKLKSAIILAINKGFKLINKNLPSPFH